MRKSLLLFTFLIFGVQVKSQNTEVEIYLIQSNSIVKGVLVESLNDSVIIRVDSLNTLTFAKSELEGKELPVSKEVRKFRRKLMREESKQYMNLFPGVYQIRNGEPAKGKTMFIISTIGLVGFVSSGVVFVVELLAVPGLYGVIVATAKSLVVFASAVLFWNVGSLWSMGGINKGIENKVNNRYYYRGDISACCLISHPSSSKVNLQ